MRKILISAFLSLIAFNAFAITSTVNPNIPVSNSALQSAPMRANFLATFNDINNIYNITLYKANNLSDLSSASAARSNLGLIIGANVETWAAPLDVLGGSNITNLQGTGVKAQLSTGSTTTGHCVQFDASGNTIDAGFACGSGTGSVGTTGSPSNGQIAIFSGASTITGIAGPIAAPQALTSGVSALTISTGAFATNAHLGNTFYLQLVSGNTNASAPTNPTDGQIITYELQQPGSGAAGTITWNPAFDFGAGSAPALSATNSLYDIVGFRYSARVTKWLFLGSQLGY